ncbi:formyltransferase family protein [Helicobacter sp. 13S00477-4]|uniref:formyltransferase family protein n=1 Tax=Helicobacter sp. 13S00477-4 TaxID=1905759 RepID=UPI000BA7D93E|nr:formyltransferase family protein [Helicobacter sp. 13S00477-4]PAF51508.1 hypothetical protein BKH44_05545 [Helicobacter sp. 13S00477-4]
MIYKKIILMGQGTIALEILKHLFEFKSFIEVISYKPNYFCMLKTFCEKKEIFYKDFKDSLQITNFLSTINVPTLIISANNNYIFPSVILSKNNFKIINFHNALLPQYKGVNAPIWSIYNQDSTTGITWHIVTEDIDSGNIIIQENIQLDDDITSFKLIKNLMQLGIKTFLQIKQNLLNDKLNTYPMPYSDIKPKKSNQLPNDGFLDIEWGKEKISAFLRSMDTKGILPKPKIKISQTEYIITEYKLNNPIIKTDSMLLNKNNIYMLLEEKGLGGGALKKYSNNPIYLPYYQEKIC